MQERFVFGMCLRSDIEKVEEAAVSGTALGAGIADEGGLVEPVHDFLAVLRSKVLVLLVVVCLLHDDSLLCVERFLTLNSAINSSQSKSHQ